MDRLFLEPGTIETIESQLRLIRAGFKLIVINIRFSIAYRLEHSYRVILLETDNIFHIIMGRLAHYDV